MIFHFQRVVCFRRLRRQNIRRAQRPRLAAQVSFARFFSMARTRRRLILIPSARNLRSLFLLASWPARRVALRFWEARARSCVPTTRDISLDVAATHASATSARASALLNFTARNTHARTQSARVSGPAATRSIRRECNNATRRQLCVPFFLLLFTAATVAFRNFVVATSASGYVSLVAPSQLARGSVLAATRALFPHFFACCRFRFFFFSFFLKIDVTVEFIRRRFFFYSCRMMIPARNGNRASALNYIERLSN